MSHATLVLSCGLLLSLSGCSRFDEPAPPPGASSPTHRRVAVTAALAALASGATALAETGVLAAETRGRTTEPAPEAAAALGTWEADVTATRRLAGLFGSLVAAKVRGSTLELRADGSYIGRKDGAAQSRGTWQLTAGKLAMAQTHEGGEPAPGQASCTTRGGVLTIRTRRHGLPITLVFRRGEER